MVKHVGFSPIVASRNYTYANIAAYECIVAGYPSEFTSLAGQVNGLDTLPKADTSRKIDYEFAALLAFCKVGESVTFPEGSMQDYVAKLKQEAQDSGMPDDMFKNTVAFADIMSNAIVAWSKKDNYAQTRSASRYNVIDSAGRWIPTPPAYTSAMEPH